MPLFAAFRSRFGLSRETAFGQASVDDGAVCVDVNVNMNNEEIIFVSS